MDRPGAVARPRTGTRRRAGLILGAALFLLILALPEPAGLEPRAWRTAAVGILMATWWVTEAIPIPATALLPLALFPILGVASMVASAAPFANPIIYLFLGGFLLAQAMQHWGLPRRIALGSVRVFGTRPRAIIAGIMVSCALLSMWVSNTATALMMLPIGISLVELVPGDRTDPARRRFATALMLGIAYACSVGGLGTLIGTPPNAFLAGFMLESYGVTIGFAEWMVVGVPLVLVGLPLTFLILTRVVFPVESTELPGGRDLVERELSSLGPTSVAEKRLGAVFALTALLWITRPILSRWIPGLSDPGIAVAAALLLFLVPAGNGKGDRLLNWRLAEGTPWGVLILFGGGLSLAAAVQATGLSGWVGENMSGMANWPLLLLLVTVIGAIILLTELTSNTATAATFLPVLGAVAVGIGKDPLLLAVPAALAASSAFMLPVATPPNAIVYGSGSVSIQDMVRAGVWMNALFLVLLTVGSYLLAPVFGI
jgi:sodium-dependent dicarboxylate transporter 2/3/5